MIHDLQCSECGAVTEFILTADEGDMEVACDCGAKMTRKTHKVFSVPQIQGETVAGGCNYTYYDPHLGRQINGKNDRADEMKRQGLSEYAPSSHMAEYESEMKHIGKHATPDEKKVASEAAKSKLKAAKRKETRERISQSFDAQRRRLGI